MSPLSWQDAAAGLLALAALAWLVASRLRARRAGAACANCPSGKPVPGVRPAPALEILLGIGEPASDKAKTREPASDWTRPANPH